MTDLSLGLAIGDWAARGLDAFGVQWRIESWEGFEDTAPVRLNMPDRAGADGGVDQRGFKSSRVVSWVGNATAPDEATLAAAKIRARAAAGDLDTGVDVTVTIHGTDYMVHGKQTPNATWQFAPLANGSLSFRYQASLTCDDPRIYSATLKSATAGLVDNSAGTGEKSYPYDYPYDFGGPTALPGLMSVTNGGTQTTYPMITVTGPSSGTAANLRLDDAASSAHLTISQLSAGQYVVLDTRLRRVLLNGTVPSRSLLAAGSEWFGLPPGFDTVSFSAAAFSDAGVQMTWRDAY